MSGAQDTGGLPPISDKALSEAFGKILEHPELISMVAGVLGENSDKSEAGIKGATDTAPSQGRAVASERSDAGDSIATLMPLISKLSGAPADGGKPFKHEPLLCALKPYLGQRRQETVDQIIRLSKLSSIINGMR